MDGRMLRIGTTSSGNDHQETSEIGTSSLGGAVKGSNNVIDFHQYDEFAEEEGFLGRTMSSGPRSTLIEVDDEEEQVHGATGGSSRQNAWLSESSRTLTVGQDGRRQVSVDDISTKFPVNVLRTFGDDSATSSTVEIEEGTADKEDGRSMDVFTALVKCICKALNGESVVTAPILYKGFDWLGRITVKPEGLKGNIMKHRTYHVQGQILAGGHLLPWKIGRMWRYSELRRLLVDELQGVVRMHGHEAAYRGLFAKFPGKTWQARNTDETAKFRAKAIEEYITEMLQITSGLIEKKEFEKNSKKNRRSRGSNLSMGSSELNFLSSSASASSSSRRSDESGMPRSRSFENLRRYTEDGKVIRRNSLDDIAGEGLGDIIEIIVTKLLSVDKTLRLDIARVSQELGALITSTPTDHCHVTKEFKITPQQAL